MKKDYCVTTNIYIFLFLRTFNTPLGLTVLYLRHVLIYSILNETNNEK